MNRSILIVICDFLLVSLLAFSTVDMNKVVEEGTRSRRSRWTSPTNQAEQPPGPCRRHEAGPGGGAAHPGPAVGELTQTKDAAGKQQALLSEREKLLAEERRNRDRLVEELAQTKDTVGKEQILLG